MIKKPVIMAYIKAHDTRNNRIVYILERDWIEKRKLMYLDRMSDKRYFLLINNRTFNEQWVEEFNLIGYDIC